MKIIIIGAGQVGSTLAENLAREYHDITLIDLDEARLQFIQDHHDIRTVTGTGCHPDILLSAGIEDADMLVSVTNSDEINIVACQVAHSIFNTPKKIARVRARNYFIKDYKDLLFSDSNMPIDVLIEPEQAVTDYVRKLVEQPVDFVADVNVEQMIVELIVIVVDSDFDSDLSFGNICYYYY